MHHLRFIVAPLLSRIPTHVIKYACPSLQKVLVYRSVVQYQLRMCEQGLTGCPILELA